MNRAGSAAGVGPLLRRVLCAGQLPRMTTSSGFIARIVRPKYRPMELPYISGRAGGEKTVNTKPPKWCIVKIDETRDWIDEMVSRCGGRIFGVHLFDANRAVHCCELTPSYECFFVESVAGEYPEADDDRERLRMGLDEASAFTPPVHYFHCNVLDKLKWITAWEMTDDEWKKLLADVDGDEDAAYNNAVDAALEYVRSNTCY